MSRTVIRYYELKKDPAMYFVMKQCADVLNRTYNLPNCVPIPPACVPDQELEGIQRMQKSLQIAEETYGQEFERLCFDMGLYDDLFGNNEEFAENLWDFSTKMFGVGCCLCEEKFTWENLVMYITFIANVVGAASQFEENSNEHLLKMMTVVIYFIQKKLQECIQFNGGWSGSCLALTNAINKPADNPNLRDFWSNLEFEYDEELGYCQYTSTGVAKALRENHIYLDDQFKKISWNICDD